MRGYITHTSMFITVNRLVEHKWVCVGVFILILYDLRLGICSTVVVVVAAAVDLFGCFFFFYYFAPAIQEKLANATGENQLKRQRTNKQMKEMKYTRSYINMYFKADWMQPVRRTISNEKTSTGRTEERHTHTHSHKKHTHHTIPQQQHANLPTI